MEVYVQQAVEWIQALSPISIYLIFFAIAYLENILPPIPGDVLVAFGGYLAAEQVIGFMPILILTTIASVIGFLNMYAFGYYFGDRIEKLERQHWLIRLIDIKYFDKGKRWMDRWGQGVILANRFLAGTRSVISLLSGITKTNIYSTTLSSFLSSIAWNTLLLTFGWVVHENWQTIGNYLSVYGWIILILLTILFAARYLYKRYRKSQVRA
jgi:membrane protein DedA with SNARE-associated domain